MATIRKYEISCAIIIQALSQLKKLYKEDWNSITANCDTKLFLGCDDVETIEWLLKMLGKKTTVVENTSYQANGGGSTSYNHSSLELLTIDQISMMADDECLVRVRGKRPHYGKKYNIEKHPNYEYAMSLKGEYEIPLSPELQAKRDRNRGPLRLRTAARGITEAQLELEEDLQSLSSEIEATANPETKEETVSKKEKNKERKERAEEAEQTQKNAPKKEIPPEQLDYEAAKDLLATFGVDTNSTEIAIREAVETEIELIQPSNEVLKYGITT